MQLGYVMIYLFTLIQQVFMSTDYTSSIVLGVDGLERYSLQFFSPQKYRSQPVIHNRINMKDEIKKQIQNFQRSSLLIEELTNYDKEVYFNSCIIQN